MFWFHNYHTLCSILIFQMYRLNAKGQIGVGERCIEAPSGDTLHMSFCDTQPTGPWDWNEVSMEIIEDE